MNNDPKPLARPSLVERLSVWWRNFRNRKTSQAYVTLCKALREDPGYAHSWGVNIEMTIYDHLRSEHYEGEEAREIAGPCAEKLMKHLFGVNWKSK